MVREGEEGKSLRSTDSLLRGSSQRHGWIPTVIVDNSALFRGGLIHILAGTRFRVLAGCASLNGMRKSALNHRVCLALIGLYDDARAVLTEVSCLKAQYECLRVVIFSDRFDLGELLAAIASGGDCYLLKNETTPDVLLKSLDLVLLGVTTVPQGFTQLIRSQVSVEQDTLSSGNYPGMHLEFPWTQFPLEAVQADETARFSNREELILFHMTQGASNKHIARELNITEATVKTYVKALLHKICARNRTQAAVWAINHLGPSRFDKPKVLEAKRRQARPLAQLEERPDLGDEAAVARQAAQRSALSCQVF